MAAVARAAAPKVALVTGSARGIGEAIALRLARDGYAVAISDLPVQEDLAKGVVSKIEAAGGKATWIPVDVSNRDNVFEAVREAKAKLGGFGMIVNNAGIAPVGPVLQTTEQTMDKAYQINVKGVLWGIQAAATTFIESETKGRILSLSSIAGREGFANLGAYCASKHAVKALTQATARELGAEGIVANCICPGVVATDMWKSIDRDMNRLTGKTEAGASMTEFGKGITLGRFQTAEDVANVASFFGSTDSDYVTGQMYVVDGGIIFH